MATGGRRPAGAAWGILGVALILCAAGLLVWTRTLLEERALGRALLDRARVPGQMSPANTAYAAALSPFFRLTESPRPRVGVQVGHWRQGEMPPELARLQDSTGASWGSVQEVEVNLAIARELVRLLGAAGMDADLLPSVVPPGYRADAFVAIHADGAARPGARGWKIAAPWRASRSSNLLMEEVTRSYALLAGLPEDRYGITYGMKGYYAFSPHRYRHAVSPFTPSIIVETGFLTVAADRQVIVEQPARVASTLASGIVRYLARRPPPISPEGRMALLPPTYAAATVAVEESLLRTHPGDDEPLVARLAQGTAVVPMQLRGEWAEVVVRGNYRSFGWVRAADLRLAG